MGVTVSNGGYVFHRQRIAGVDEAGRGPLAGPVVAAAVMLDPECPIDGLDDSKRLSARRRERLAVEIRDKALCWAVALCDVGEIDSLNILQASLLAMQRAVERLSIVPDHVQVDGNRCPTLSCTVEAIVRGDQRVPAICAASILAKVQRDAIMVELDARFPGYGFAKHKGYPSRAHIASLQALGVTPVHRRTFKPVRTMLAGD